MKIELTDVNTGEVTTVEHDNMMTDAINNILGLNLLGTLYYFGSTYNNSLNGWMTNLLPICPNLIGGILLFPNTLEEDSGNIYPTSENLPVSYASNDVNSSTDLQRGSLSQTEGGATDDGYQFVWKFTSTQGNGTILCYASGRCLTAARLRRRITSVLIQFCSKAPAYQYWLLSRI